MRIAILAAGALAIAISTEATAQSVSASNYRQYAACEEVQVSGRWFNTFGEGRCPPGSRRVGRSQSARTGSDVNALNMRRMEGSVRALGDMQQGVLAVGRAIGARYQAESDRRAAEYAYHLLGDVTVPAASLYSPGDFQFPLSGRVVYAGLGDALLTTSKGFISQCFIPLEDGTAIQIGGHRHNVRNGELTCKLKEKDRVYTPLYSNYSFSGGEMSMGQTLQKKNGLYTVCYRNMGMNSMCVKGIPADRIVETSGIVEVTSSSRNLATFAGVDNGKLSVRLEGADSQASPTSNSQVLTFDLNTSRVVEIGGATFDVLAFSEQEVVMQRR